MGQQYCCKKQISIKNREIKVSNLIKYWLFKNLIIYFFFGKVFTSFVTSLEEKVIERVSNYIYNSCKLTNTNILYNICRLLDYFSKIHLINEMKFFKTFEMVEISNGVQN